MFKCNSKMRIRKYPISISWYNFFSANVSDFYFYFTTTFQKLCVSRTLNNEQKFISLYISKALYLHNYKKPSQARSILLITNLPCYVVFYTIFKFRNIQAFFFFLFDIFCSKFQDVCVLHEG